MCSVSGFISPNFSRSHIQRMNRSMAHRGPDAGGIFFNEAQYVALAHNRLSILDLSENENQPFYSSCGRYVMVFNGEIYNFADLRNKIEVFSREKAELNAKSKNIEVVTEDKLFKTNSDTEVLAEGFAFWGMNMAEKLNGMFAFTIYDQEEEALYLFRDRMGIKPLYYYQRDDDFAFASEIKGLSSLLLDRELAINQDAIQSFLHLGYINNNQTIFKEIHALPAGCVGIYKDKQLKIIPYWQAEDKIAADTLGDEKTAKKSLKTLIEKSVQKRMISDVPIGTFLSGGTDSSLITAIANKFHPSKLKTFSIGFKEAKYDESKHAKSVAEHLKTEHHEFILSHDEALEKVADLTAIYDQPFADSSAIPTLLVSHYAKKHVSVALSGDGGDELFMGYGMYNWAKRLQNPFVKAVRPLLKTGLSMHPNHRYKRAALLFQKHSESKSHIFSQEQYLFSEAELGKLLKSAKKPTRTQDSFNKLKRNLSAVEAQAFFDLTNYLKDDLLVKVDIASMQSGLEVRVPLLDHRIVEFALNLNQKLKLNKDSSKYLLKQVLYDYLPKQLMERPKWGFSIPLDEWLGKELRPLIDQYLEESLVEAAGIVHFSEVKKLITRFDKGHKYLYNRLWTLILLHKWLYENGRINHS